jgi:hypothetical protein
VQRLLNWRRKRSTPSIPEATPEPEANNLTAEQLSQQPPQDAIDAAALMCHPLADIDGREDAMSVASADSAAAAAGLRAGRSRPAASVDLGPRTPRPTAAGSVKRRSPRSAAATPRPSGLSRSSSVRRSSLKQIDLGALLLSPDKAAFLASASPKVHLHVQQFQESVICLPQRQIS